MSKSHESDLCAHEDYRNVLRQCFEEKKKANPSLSYGSIAHRVGLDRSFISLLLGKKRHLDIRKVEKVAEVFGVPEHRKDFFYLLYLNNRIANGSSRSVLQMILEKYRESAAAMDFGKGATQLAQPLDQAHQNTLNWKVQALATFPEFKPDAHWIKERLADTTLSLAEIQHALGYLLRHGFISRPVKGREDEGWHVKELAEVVDPVSPGVAGASLAVLFQDLSCFLAEPPRFRPWSMHGMIHAFDEDSLLELKEAEIQYRKKVEEISRRSARRDRVLFLHSGYYTVTKTD